MKEFFKRHYKLYYFLVSLYDFALEKYCSFILNPEKVVIKRYKKRLGEYPDLMNPKTFNEKIQWLKLNWYDPYAIKCADKYGVRKVIKEKIGSGYLNDLIAVYDKVEDIDLDKLPESFVLKGTHGSGFNIICKNKSNMNWNKEFLKMQRWLRTKYYVKNGEWVYKGIKPRIICEAFIEDETQKYGLTDYKFYCFNGEPTFCQVIKDRNKGGTIDFFDMDWNHMEFRGLQNLPNSSDKIDKPEALQEMIDIAKKLSDPFPFVRVDFYYVNKKVYFGEMTFFPRSGFGTFIPYKWNEIIGNKLKLPKKNI